MKVIRSKANLSSRITVDANIAMNSKKLTGLAAGSASGNSLRYEQVIGVFLPLAGGTMAGNITLGAHKIITSNLSLYEYNSSTIAIRDAAGNDDKKFRCFNFHLQGDVYVDVNAKGIRLPNVDNNYHNIYARDNGSGVVEIARYQGAADPYFQATLPMVHTPGTLPGTVVEGHMGYLASADAMWWRDASRYRWFGEDILVAHGNLAETGQNAKMFAWRNTRIGGDVLVLRVIVNITSGSSAAAKLNVGMNAADATSDNLIDEIACDSVACSDNLADPGTNGKAKQVVVDDAYVTGYEANVADPEGVVGTYTIIYIPL